MTDVQPNAPPRKRTTHKKRALAPMDPSLPHRDARREAFVQNLFEGKDLYEAYELAGFKHAKGNSQRMEKEPAIVARLSYLRQRVDELDLVARGYRRLEVRRTLNAIVKTDRTGMFEEVEVERTIGRGKKAVKIKSRFLQLKPLAQLTDEQKLLFEGLGDGGRAIMPAKLTALAQLARLDGLDAGADTNVGVAVNVGLGERLDAARRRLEAESRPTLVTSPNPARASSPQQPESSPREDFQLPTRV